MRSCLHRSLHPPKRDIADLFPRDLQPRSTLAIMGSETEQETIIAVRVLELFSGIGGCAAALVDVAQDVLAFDIRQSAVDTYRHNYPNHQCELRTIESLPTSRLSTFAADLWWMSPPCQPFTAQGQRRDLHDARTQSFIMLLRQLASVRPTYVAMENVPGFFSSETRKLFLQVLEEAGYTFREWDLCPTQLEWPMRRRRYYLVASRHHDLQAPTLAVRTRWSDLWNSHLTAGKQPPFPEDDMLLSYCKHLHLLQFHAPDGVARCFTSAYGRSPLRSGSYILENDGRIRHFAPTEMLRLMGFPAMFQIPDSVPTRTAWALIGNSLAVPAVRHVLSSIPEIAATR